MLLSCSELAFLATVSTAPSSGVFLLMEGRTGYLLREEEAPTGTCCSSSGTSSGAPCFGDLGAQAPGFWLPGDSQGMAGGGGDAVR